MRSIGRHRGRARSPDADDGGGERHPLQILATLSGHYSRVLRLSGSDVTDEKSAAALLGLRGSTFPAAQGARSGAAPRSAGRGEGLRAVGGRRSRHAGPRRVARRPVARGVGGPPVAPRRPPGAGGRLGLLGGQLLHEARLAPGGLVLVDDPLGGGLVEALLSQLPRGVGILTGAPRANRGLDARS